MNIEQVCTIQHVIHVFFYRTCAVISRGLYNCIFLTNFFTTVYIVERLVLLTIYVPKKGNSSIFGPFSLIYLHYLEI